MDQISDEEIELVSAGFRANARAEILDSMCAIAIRNGEDPHKIVKEVMYATSEISEDNASSMVS